MQATELDNVDARIDRLTRRSLPGMTKMTDALGVYLDAARARRQAGHQVSIHGVAQSLGRSLSSTFAAFRRLTQLGELVERKDSHGKTYYQLPDENQLEANIGELLNTLRSLDETGALPSKLAEYKFMWEKGWN